MEAVLRALVEQGALEEQEGGADFPGEGFLHRWDDEAALDGEGVGVGDVFEGSLALLVEVFVEEDVDGGHAAGVIEAAVEPAGAADGEGFGEIGPGEAKGEFEEEEVEEGEVFTPPPG
ncbi:MAG TPA: hypothetical protein VIU40_12735, partial [Geobacteraceae bacterium]